MIAHVPVLETERLTLRRPAPRDWPQARDFFMSDRASGIGGPDTLGVAWRAFATKLGHWQIHGFGMWTATRKDDDTALGMFGAWCPADWPENEIGWLIFAQDLEGTGLAFEAARAAVDHDYQTLGWTTVVSYITHDNARSIALATRLGARLDANATPPRPDNPCLVYRHPAPEALQ